MSYHTYFILCLIYFYKFQSKPSFDLNVAACRVVLGILPALEVQVLGDTEGLIKRLFNWAVDAKEPLQSYATGLLAVAMEIQDIATETEFRCENWQQHYFYSFWYLIWDPPQCANLEIFFILQVTE